MSTARWNLKEAYIGRIKFLGYGFYSSKDGIKLCVHAKSIIKMKAKVKELTSRSSGLGYEMLKLKLKQFITGWVNYFKLADMKKMLETTDKWLRRRIRMYIWKQWKKVRERTNLSSIWICPLKGNRRIFILPKGSHGLRIMLWNLKSLLKKAN